MLSAEELAELRKHDLWTEAEQTALLAHVDAQAAELEALRAEVRRALYLTSLDEVMGRGVLAGDVPLIAALLRSPEGT